MHALMIIGMTGQGKSDFVKSLVRGKKIHAFDINDEYYFPKINYDANGNPARTQFSEADCKYMTRHTKCDEKLFISECSKLKDTYCVFEDATGFFSGKIPQDLKRLIVGKRFSKNTYLFLFHSIQDAPPGLVRLCNHVVLFKTNDEPHTVEKKYTKLLQPFLKLQSAPNHSKLIIKLIDQ